jgi:hypothetical protein
MTSDMVESMLHFLDLYRLDSSVTDMALDYGYDLVKGFRESDTFGLDPKLIKQGEKASRHSYRNRTLDESPLLFDPSHQFANKYFAATRESSSAEVPKNPLLETLLRQSQWIRSQAEAEGISLDAYMERAARQAEERRRQQLLVPDIRALLLKKFLLRLDAVVEEVEALEEFGVKYKNVPSELRMLLVQAHESHLLNMDAATAMLCGAVIEGSLKDRLSSDGVMVPRRAGLDTLFELALEHNVFGQPSMLYTLADEVREMRNAALHEPIKFQSASEMVKTALLTNTRRFVTEILTADLPG